MILKNAHVFLQTIIKTHVKLQKHRSKTVGGVKRTKYLLPIHSYTSRAKIVLNKEKNVKKEKRRIACISALKHLQSLKGIGTEPNKQELSSLFATHRLDMMHVLVKFHEYILNGCGDMA